MSGPLSDEVLTGVGRVAARLAGEAWEGKWVPSTEDKVVLEHVWKRVAPLLAPPDQNAEMTGRTQEASQNQGRSDLSE